MKGNLKCLLVSMLIIAANCLPISQLIRRPLRRRLAKFIKPQANIRETNETPKKFNQALQQPQIHPELVFPPHSHQAAPIQRSTSPPIPAGFINPNPEKTKEVPASKKLTVLTQNSDVPHDFRGEHNTKSKQERDKISFHTNGNTGSPSKQSASTGDEIDIQIPVLGHPSIPSEETTGKHIDTVENHAAGSSSTSRTDKKKSEHDHYNHHHVPIILNVHMPTHHFEETRHSNEHIIIPVNFITPELAGSSIFSRRHDRESLDSGNRKIDVSSFDYKHKGENTRSGTVISGDSTNTDTFLVPSDLGILAENPRPVLLDSPPQPSSTVIGGSEKSAETIATEENTLGRNKSTPFNQVTSAKNNHNPIISSKSDGVPAENPKPVFLVPTSDIKTTSSDKLLSKSGKSNVFRTSKKSILGRSRVSDYNSKSVLSDVKSTAIKNVQNVNSEHEKETTGTDFNRFESMSVTASSAKVATKPSKKLKGILKRMRQTAGERLANIRKRNRKIKQKSSEKSSYRSTFHNQTLMKRNFISSKENVAQKDNNDPSMHSKYGKSSLYQSDTSRNSDRVSKNVSENTLTPDNNVNLSVPNLLVNKLSNNLTVTMNEANKKSISEISEKKINIVPIQKLHKSQHKQSKKKGATKPRRKNGFLDFLFLSSLAG